MGAEGTGVRGDPAAEGSEEVAPKAFLARSQAAFRHSGSTLDLSAAAAASCRHRAARGSWERARSAGPYVSSRRRMPSCVVVDKPTAPSPSGHRWALATAGGECRAEPVRFRALALDRRSRGWISARLPGRIPDGGHAATGCGDGSEPRRLGRCPRQNAAATRSTYATGATLSRHRPPG